MHCSLLHTNRANVYFPLAWRLKTRHSNCGHHLKQTGAHLWVQRPCGGLKPPTPLEHHHGQVSPAPGCPWAALTGCGIKGSDCWLGARSPFLPPPRADVDPWLPPESCHQLSPSRRRKGHLTAWDHCVGSSLRTSGSGRSVAQAQMA